MPQGKALTAKSLIKKADKRLDPIVLVILVAVYFVDKITTVKISLTFEEALLINIAAGAMRSIWEEFKIKTGFLHEEEQQD